MHQVEKNDNSIKSPCSLELIQGSLAFVEIVNLENNADCLQTINVPNEFSTFITIGKNSWTDLGSVESLNDVGEHCICSFQEVQETNMILEQTVKTCSLVFFLLSCFRIFPCN